MKTQAERVLALVEKLGLSISAFEKSLGYSNGSIYRLKDKQGITMAMAKRITDTYPQVSMHWLLTGEGDIYKGEKSVINITKGNGNVSNTGNNNVISNKTGISEELENELRIKEELLTAKDETIRQKDEIIALLRDKVALLEKLLEK